MGMRFVYLMYSSTCRRSVRWQIGLMRSRSAANSSSVRQIPELSFETFEVAEGVIVNDAYQAVKFLNGILQRRCRQQNFGAAAIAFLMAFAMRFVGL